MASNSGYPFQLLNAVIQVNELQPRRAVQRLKAELDWPTAARTMRTPLLLEGRNLLDPTPLLAAGFTHMSVGRPTHRPT
ncbi:hypothetical protein [Streptomyces sp. B27]|uniref:hypothetical protein n=1 Tax=Streptomyces sp. B27 TaxID=2485015 RepID=UPI001F0C46C3|nr:hypothetical protein [Streptomyces sp. B27]